MNQPIERLICLFHRRWALPVIAELHAARGAKFITLAKRLHAGRETLHATLQDLIQLRLVQHNTGYGHPMRPEYLLTPAGSRLGEPAQLLLKTVQRLEIQPLAFRKWTMPVTWTLGHGVDRFNHLRDELPGITSRALTLSLKEMQEQRLVRRDVLDAYPPITSYRLNRRAQPVLQALEPVAEAV